MDQRTIPLGRIMGIPIRLDYSWFLIFALMTWSLAVGYYPAEFKKAVEGLTLGSFLLHHRFRQRAISYATYESRLVVMKGKSWSRTTMRLSAHNAEHPADVPLKRSGMALFPFYSIDMGRRCCVEACYQVDTLSFTDHHPCAFRFWLS